jgi:alpha-tubulin suppressor-like RCC1 family protein
MVGTPRCGVRTAQRAVPTSNWRNLIQTWLLCGAMLQVFTSEAQTVVKVAAAANNSLFLKSDGSLWAMGRNQYGELGDGTFNQTNRPELIVAGSVTAVAAGYFHSLFLKNDGSLWAMGYNSQGELGDGAYGTAPYYATNRPEQIVATNVTAIAAGGGHSLFLKSNGSLWAMGYNGYGELGDGSYTRTARPEQIVATNVTAIAAGSYYSLFLKTDGSLWAMGDNFYGQLGDGSGNITTNRPEQIVSSNVTAIAAGYYHSLFLKSDGSLWAMGYNNRGQLGDGTTSNTNRPEQIVASNVTAIAAGYYHSLFLKNDGSLWGMGYNYQGELGDGTYTTLPPYGTNQPEQIVVGNVTVVAAGYYHSLFLKRDGSLWGMGYNGYGQLGDGTTSNTNRPEQIVAGVSSGFNQISCQLLSGGSVRLSFVGIAGTNYALDRATSLSPPDWIPQTTNPAGPGGALVFTNAPDPASNNFWRIRSVP